VTIDRPTGMIALEEGDKLIAPNEDRVTWAIQVHPELDLEDATDMLSGVMEAISTHPNINPMALQGALMGALLHSGKQ
jgi:hypothetical protein